MYTGLFHTHSFIRYAVLILLYIVIVAALRGWLRKKPYTSTDNKLSLYLFIATHLQLLVGLLLYFVSPNVQFNSSTMKEATIRYWTVEHSFIMVVAVVLITMARITAKKMSSDEAKHKRMFIFNLTALTLILIAIVMSGRGIL